MTSVSPIGRQDPNFMDHNQTLIQEVLQEHPDLKTLEMETSMLLTLAYQSVEPLFASGCAMVFANRVQDTFIDKDLVKDLELKAGKSVLEALVAFPLESLSHSATN